MRPYFLLIVLTLLNILFGFSQTKDKNGNIIFTNSELNKIYEEINHLNEKVNEQQNLIENLELQLKLQQAGLNESLQPEKKLYEPKPTVSQFAAAIPNIDKGLKLLCFFSPTCDHCQGAGKDIVSVLEKSNVKPKVHIAFQEEPEEVPNFFKIIGREFNHQVFEIRQFMKVFGISNDVPGVVLMWNGNIIKFYQGSGDAAFSKDKLIKDLKDIENKLKQ